MNRLSPTFSSLIVADGDATCASSKPEPTHAELVAMRNRCLTRAAIHISDAELLLAQGRPGSACILATLGLEEIGKGELQLLKLDSGAPFIEEQRESAEEGETDHRRKLTWAFLTGTASTRMPRPEDLPSARKLAEILFNRRKNAAYSPGIDEPEFAAITREETEPIVGFARARLEIAQAATIATLDDERRGQISWLFKQLADAEFRGFMLSTPHVAKAEDPKLNWLTSLENDWSTLVNDNREVLKAELEKDATADADSTGRRWQVTLKFESGWHRLRPKVLQKWNELDDVPYTFEVNKKNDRHLIVKLKLPKKVPLAGAWPVGHDLSRLLLLALNFGTFGLFSWHVSRHKTKFTDAVRDLDMPGAFILERKDPGDIDWGGERTISFEDLQRVAKCFGYLVRHYRPGKPIPFLNYELGTGAWALNDINANLAPGAFAYFYSAYKSALEKFKTPDDQDVVTHLRTFYNSGDEVLKTLLPHIQELETSGNVAHDIGIKHATFLKMATDLVINQGVQKVFEAEVQRMNDKQETEAAP